MKTKRKITCLLPNDGRDYYLVQKKNNIFSKWKFVYNDLYPVKYPKLFTLGELIGDHIISIEEMEKYFTSNNDNITVIL